MHIVLQIPTAITPSMARLAQAMWHHARLGTFDGRKPSAGTPYFLHARQIHRRTATMLIFTRDVGHHSSGWFKNPDYERCYHLSLSFWDPAIDQARPYEYKLAALWVRCFYGEWTKYVWEEGPSIPVLKHVRHYRVFCDEYWQAIIPRGEVYSKKLTEIGWKSFSEQGYQNLIEISHD